jgi:hypothetical protein
LYSVYGLYNRAGKCSTLASLRALSAVDDMMRFVSLSLHVMLIGW